MAAASKKGRRRNPQSNGGGQMGVFNTNLQSEMYAWVNRIAAR